MTLDQCKSEARRVAHSLPPSDFGSTRAIDAFAVALRAAILAERKACMNIVLDNASRDVVDIAELIEARNRQD